MDWAVAVKEDFIHAISDLLKKVKLLFQGIADKTTWSAQWIISHLESFTLYSAVPNNPSNALKFR